MMESFVSVAQLYLPHTQQPQHILSYNVSTTHPSTQPKRIPWMWFHLSFGLHSYQTYRWKRIAFVWFIVLFSLSSSLSVPPPSLSPHSPLSPCLSRGFRFYVWQSAFACGRRDKMDSWQKCAGKKEKDRCQSRYKDCKRIRDWKI